MKRTWRMRSDADRAEAVREYLDGAPPSELVARFGTTAENIRQMAIKRYGPAAPVIARMNRLDDPADVQALMTAIEQRLTKEAL